MKKFLMIATALMVSISANAHVTPSAEETPENASTTTTQTMTFGELKAIYGENIEIEGSNELTDQTVIEFTKTTGPPCGGGEQPCGAALAQARHDAQLLANECCCIQINGVECCNNDGSFIAILFIVEPRGCN